MAIHSLADALINAQVEISEIMRWRGSDYEPYADEIANLIKAMQTLKEKVVCRHQYKIVNSTGAGACMVCGAQWTDAANPNYRTG